MLRTRVVEVLESGVVDCGVRRVKPQLQRANSVWRATMKVESSREVVPGFPSQAFEVDKDREKASVVGGER
jgi:hypothetical protein